MDRLHRFLSFNEKGQGIVEYAFILVLVAVVVIPILLALGPTVGGVFSDIVEPLGYDLSGVISSAVAQPRSNANTVKFQISVATNTNITVDIGSGSKTESCSGSCTITLNATQGVIASGGTATITASEGGRVTISYPSFP